MPPKKTVERPKLLRESKLKRLFNGPGNKQHKAMGLGLQSAHPEGPLVKMKLAPVLQQQI